LTSVGDALQPSPRSKRTSLLADVKATSAPGAPSGGAFSTSVGDALQPSPRSKRTSLLVDVEATSVRGAPSGGAFLTSVGDAPQRSPRSKRTSLLGDVEVSTVAPDSDLSAPLPGLADRSFDALPLDVDRQRVMRRVLADLRFSSRAEEAQFSHAWGLDRSAQLLTSFAWFAACDPRFWPADNEAEASERRLAVEEVLRPSLAMGYARLLAESALGAEDKDLLAFYLPEALAFGAIRALREAFPRSAKALRDPDLAQQFFSSFASLCSTFGQSRVPGRSRRSFSSPRSGARSAGGASEAARNGVLDQIQERARAVALSRTRPSAWLREQLQPNVLLDTATGTPRAALPSIRATRAEIQREQVEIGTSALALRSCPVEVPPKAPRKTIDINEPSSLLSQWLQARASGSQRGNSTARRPHVIRYTDPAERQELQRRQQQQQQQAAARRERPAATQSARTYRDVRKESARKCEQWREGAARMRERVNGESEGANATLLVRREELDRAQHGLDEAGRHEVANLLVAMRRIEVPSVHALTSRAHSQR